MEDKQNQQDAVRLPQSGFDFYSCLMSKGTLAKFNAQSLKKKQFPPEIQQMINYCTPALKHGRPLNKVMIVLVGQTGSGKSTTINYLFNDNICSVNSSSSETRRVTEYGKELCVTTESPPVIGLLSFVDPPGALDVDHTKEPLNLATIAKFCREHPDLLPRKGLMNMSSKVREQVYPNLVILNIKANDNRMDGPDSNLRKCLKALNEYGLLDRQHTNLMVIVTHAMSISKKRYVQRTQETTRIIQDAVFRVLRLQDVQVVFVENIPEDYDMDKDEDCDFFKLPDGQLSHYNLIRAMEMHFDKNNDVLGKLLCGWYFSDDCPEKKTKANILEDIAHTQLSEEERSRALQDLLSMDLQFSVHEESTVPAFNFQFLGRGYCPKSERVTDAIVYSEKEMSRVKLLGTWYNIPKCFEVVETNVHHCYPFTCETEEMYLKERMASYGLEDDIKLDLHVDATGRWLKSSSSVTDPTFSVMYEKRLLNVQIASSGKDVKPQLMEAINLLPPKYNESNAHAYSEFFMKWGSHFVCKVWVGGGIKMDCGVSLSEHTEQVTSGVCKTVQDTLLNLESGENRESAARKDVLENFNLSIIGGDPPRLSTLDELTRVRFHDWVQSIKKKPAELEYSLGLRPYYSLTIGLRALSLSEATQQYLDGTMPEYLPVRRDVMNSRNAYSSISAELQIPRTPSQIKRDRRTQSQKARQTAPPQLEVKSSELAMEGLPTVSQPQRVEYLPTRNQVGRDMVQNAKMKAKQDETCFPPWAKVYIKNGEVPISRLMSGDEVLTINCSSGTGIYKLTRTEFHTFLHYDSEKKADFLVFHLANGQSLTITADHLLFLQQGGVLKSVRAKYLKVGNELLCVSNEKLGVGQRCVKLCRIIKITQITAEGVYSPLTHDGTLIVDGVLVSCYGHIDSHVLAHTSMIPLCLWNRTRNGMRTIINYVFQRIVGSAKLADSHSLIENRWSTGIHLYAELLMAVRSKVPLQILRD